MREDTHETLYIMPDQHSECTNDVIIIIMIVFLLICQLKHQVVIFCDSK